MRQFITTVVAAIALVSAAACGTSQITAPTPAGPSTSALALTMTTTPDSLNADGGSQSAIAIQASNASGGPQVGLPLRIELAVAGTPESCGTLSGTTIVTDSNGRATAVYTAPSLPLPLPQCTGFAGVVTIIATPTGSNFQTTSSRSSSIRLTAAGTILPPAGSPTAAFIFTPTPATAGLPLRFDASSSKVGAGATQITTYSWDFGDGTSASGKTSTHTFTSASSYTVTLTVTNDRGLSASTTQLVAVGAPAPGTAPTPDFTVSPTSAGVSDTIFFNASTSAPGPGHTIVTFNWTFGDGTTAAGVTTTHVYATAGTYVVQLSVIDEAGQGATSAGKSITIGGANPSAPGAAFTSSPVAPTVNELVVFDSSSTTVASGQSIVDVAWNFGDDTPIIHGPPNSTRITSHNFQRVGTFVVNLVVTDSVGRTGSIFHTVPVGTPNPTALLSLIKTGGNSIQADGSGSTATGGTSITNYHFVWGDGQPDTSGAASSAGHVYGAIGLHTITLIVTDSLGRTGSTQQSVTTP